MRRARWKRKNVRDDLTPPCQITQDGGWPPRTVGKIQKSLAGCADRYSSNNCAPASVGAAFIGVQRGHPLPHFPLPLPLSLEGFPKGKAPKRRRGRIQRGAFEEMARLAVHQGRESYSHDGVRAAARPFVSFHGGGGGNRNPPAILFRGPGGHSLFKREYPLGFSVPKRYSSAGNSGPMWEHQIKPARRTAPRCCCPSPSRP